MLNLDARIDEISMRCRYSDHFAALLVLEVFWRVTVRARWLL